MVSEAKSGGSASTARNPHLFSNCCEAVRLDEILNIINNLHRVGATIRRIRAGAAPLAPDGPYLCPGRSQSRPGPHRRSPQAKVVLAGCKESRHRPAARRDASNRPPSDIQATRVRGREEYPARGDPLPCRNPPTPPRCEAGGGGDAATSRAAAARVTDKNPFNFLWAGLIHLALPETRFIHCRRDPIDTCLSIFFTRFATPQPLAYDRGDLVFYYRQYQRLMAHWRTVLPPDRLLEIDYETLTADPEPLTRRMVNFCGLDWDDACLAPERNRRVVRTASLWQARQPVYRGSVERWRNYAP